MTIGGAFGFGQIKVWLLGRIHEPLSQLVGVLQVDGEMLVAEFAFGLLVEHRHDIAGIVVELVRVADVQCLAVAEVRTQLVAAGAEQHGVIPLRHRLLGDVHRENHSRLFGDNGAFAVSLLVNVVREVGEDQPFKERACLASRVAEIDGRADHNHTGLAGFFERRSQPVADGAHAVGLGVLQLAGETALASRECEVVKVNHFGLRTRLHSTTHGAFQQQSRIFVFARTAVDKQRFNSLFLHEQRGFNDGTKIQKKATPCIAFSSAEREG